MITIKIANYDEIQKVFTAYPEKSAKYFNKALKKSLLKIQNRATKKAPVDTGSLRARWNLKLGFMKGSLAPANKYAPFVEYGTKPHWVSAKKLEGWASRHGIPAFLVALSIAKKGTKAQPFFEPAINEKEINKEFESALNRVLKEI